MSDKFDIKKYQNGKNIEMNIILNNYELKNYVLIPATKIEGEIQLTPKKDIQLEKNEHKILFKITQFEMFNYDSKTFGGNKEEKSKDKDEIIIQKTIYHYFPDNPLKEGDITKIYFSFYLPGDEKEKFILLLNLKKKIIYCI